MAGIYIHIPFCKQACHYCNFHFSTSMKNKEAMVMALANELVLRKTEFESEIIETIYFGGGTPSILPLESIQHLIATIYANYNVSKNPEITLEANPDDIHRQQILDWHKSPINRLSIGVQSFFEDDLKLMNRAHNATEAKKCLTEATQYFDNISIDLIYGMPNSNNEKWLININTALSFNIPHLSSYALTVEPKTALDKLISNGTIEKPSDETAQEQHQLLIDTLIPKGFIPYELSNFGKEGFFSKNNSNYWLGEKYMGIGPSAHSFDGTKRSWNIANNNLYLKAINQDEMPSEYEVLTTADRYNEYIMTGLRTIWGVSLDRITNKFGEKYLTYLIQMTEKHLQNKLLIVENGILKTTDKGRFLTDGIASDLFFVTLK